MLVKFTSVRTVIYKIVEDLGLGTDDIPYEAMIGWIGHALRHIGSYTQFVSKDAEIEIENYKGKLPEDFYRVDQDRYTAPYKVYNDTIETGSKSGTIKIAYLAMPVDEDGFPMVPDDPSYFDAMFWKVTSQLALRDQVPNKKISFEFADAKWKRYCLQARAESNMWDIHGMQRGANRALMLKPDHTDYYRRFANLANKQVLDRDGDR